MPVTNIIRGDSYPSGTDFLFEYTIQDSVGGAFGLAGHTVRTTYKTEKTDLGTDTTDSDAEIKHFITVAANGSVTDSDGLALNGTAAGGVVREYLTVAESRALPPGVELLADLEVVNEAGTRVKSIDYGASLKATEGVTNRQTDS